jgi:hypothetical protein
VVFVAAVPRRVEEHDEPRSLLPVDRRELALEPIVLRRVFP